MSAVFATLESYLHALHWLRPQWLWALGLLPVLAGAWWLRRRSRTAWQGLVDPHLLPHLLVAGGGGKGRTGLVVLLLAWTLGVLAAAGPSVRDGAQPLRQAEAPLVIALDLSEAITTPDLPPTRLVQARAKIATLLRGRSGGQVALVAFSGDAFTVAPLTDDAANVALFLDDLDPEVMPMPGQRPDRAIEESARLLRQAGFVRGGILLLTNTSDSRAQAAARLAASNGYTVSVLGLGTPAGAVYRGWDGSFQRSALDGGALAALAAAGGGRSAVLAAGTADLDALGVLRPSGVDARDARGITGRTSLDDGYWLLLPLLLLAVFAFRRGPPGIALLLVVAVAGAGAPLAPAQAQAPARIASAAPSTQSPQSKAAPSTRPVAPAATAWQRADQARQARLQAGADAYRRGDATAAEQAFAGIDDDEGWYNQGNALARQGRYDEAIAAYDRALAASPRMADAIANRAAVDAARKRKGGAGQNPQEKGKAGQGAGKQDAGKPGDPSPSPGGKGQPKDGAPPAAPKPGTDGKAPPSSEDGKGPPPPAPGTPPPAGNPPRARPPGGDDKPGGDKPGDSKPGDAAGTPAPTPAQRAEQARAQAAADQAQRERMAKAVGAAPPGTGKPAAGQAASGAPTNETPAQREARARVDAQLMRVPDHPGDLLRAKFRLEYERRMEQRR